MHRISKTLTQMLDGFLQHHILKHTKEERGGKEREGKEKGERKKEKKREKKNSILFTRIKNNSSIAWTP